MNDSFQSFRQPGASFLQPTSSSFGLTETFRIKRSFLAAATELRSSLHGLVDDLAANAVSVEGFVAQARWQVRRAYFKAYALGAISIFPFYTLTDRDVRILDEELDSETGFLRDFAADIRDNRLGLDAVSRAGLYLLALRGIFERGRREAMPAGPYRWRLGITEHCLDCLSAASNGPYQRERTSGLGLPSLPGNPGDGSVCRGLTRCGCTVELSSGIPLPNEELAGELRELLTEVVYGSSRAAEGTRAE